MQTFILICFLASAVLASREFEEFVERHQHLIPEETIARLVRERRGDNSHWCCKDNNVHVPVATQRTKIVHAYRQAYYQAKSGETNCGTFGWSRCTLYTVKSHQESYSYMSSHEVDLDKTCPSSELTCCVGFVLLNKSGGNNCFALADLDDEQKKLLSRLHKYDGLLGGK